MLVSEEYSKRQVWRNSQSKVKVSKLVFPTSLLCALKETRAECMSQLYKRWINDNMKRRKSKLVPQQSKSSEC